MLRIKGGRFLIRPTDSLFLAPRTSDLGRKKRKTPFDRAWRETPTKSGVFLVHPSCARPLCGRRAFSAIGGTAQGRWRPRCICTYTALCTARPECGYSRRSTHGEGGTGVGCVHWRASASAVVAGGAAVGALRFGAGGRAAGGCQCGAVGGLPAPRGVRVPPGGCEGAARAGGGCARLKAGLLLCGVRRHGHTHTHTPTHTHHTPTPLFPFPTPAQAHSHGRKAAAALWRCLSLIKKKGFPRLRLLRLGCACFGATPVRPRRARAVVLCICISTCLHLPGAGVATRGRPRGGDTSYSDTHSVSQAVGAVYHQHSRPRESARAGGGGGGCPPVGVAA
jgi:hypothetical protein